MATITIKPADLDDIEGPYADSPKESWWAKRRAARLAKKNAAGGGAGGGGDNDGGGGKKGFPWKKFFKWGFISGFILGLILLIIICIWVFAVTRDLPDHEFVETYEPPVMSRVHAGDGKLIAEYAEEKRVYVPISAIPEKLQQAFVSAEDQRFYTHGGVDWKGFARAMVANVKHKIKGERLEGGSSITQQVAKNFTGEDDRAVRRKVREMFMARRIEKAASKDRIMELYLNKIFFSRRSYGIAAASLNYFGKPMADLSIEEMAYLAVLPKAPNNYDPVKNKEKAMWRRNYVLRRMAEDGYITQEEADAAQKRDLVAIDGRLSGGEYLASEYFVEDTRKLIVDMFTKEEMVKEAIDPEFATEEDYREANAKALQRLNSEGLSIRTTLNTEYQLAGRRALRRGLELYDRRHGYRGPLGQIDVSGDWAEDVKTVTIPRDFEDWRVAVVLSVDGKTAKLGFSDKLRQNTNAYEALAELGGFELPNEMDDDGKPIEMAAMPEGLATGIINVSDAQWAQPALSNARVGAKPKTMGDIVAAGDVILVQAKPKQPKAAKVLHYNLRQVPDINGGLIAMDPHTGRVLALVGGYSFQQNQFNRATQANRQPGSAFKPFVYAAALNNGFTPASRVLDAPFVAARGDRPSWCDNPNLARTRATAEQCDELFYKPGNYSKGKFYGLSTLRFGLEKSLNSMTVRLASEIGMDKVSEIGERLGIYDELRPQLAMSLGAGETTMIRLASAYATVVNGGKAVEATLLDRVQNSQGQTIYLHDDRVCDSCNAEEWTDQGPPELVDEREQLMDPITAYQVTTLLEGVVLNGTGRSISVLGRPLGGKTGTTDEYRDAWFMGFSPDLVVGVYVGFDTPRTLGVGEAGGKVAAPIFRDFMGEVLEGQPIVPFRIPPGVLLSPVNRATGEPSYIGAPDYLLEAFRPGTEPRIGGLDTKIRVGSGSSTFGYGDYSGVGSDDIEDPYSGSEQGSDDNKAPNTGEDNAAGSDDAKETEDAPVAPQDGPGTAPVTDAPGPQGAAPGPNSGLGTPPAESPVNPVETPVETPIVNPIGTPGETPVVEKPKKPVTDGIY